MKIAIIGNGKMGKRITQLAEEKGYSVAIKVDSKNTIDGSDLNQVDVAIDFSTPSTAYTNIMHIIDSGIPVVSGTTGWLDKMSDVIKHCKQKKGAFLYASNFSLGMNIFFRLNIKLAQLMKEKEYKRIIHEIHHTEKLDAPSGTAKKLSSDIKDILGEETVISYDRIANVSGTHYINYNCIYDEIKIKHTAKNRDGFALGAILAAEWIIGKTGFFNFQDVLNS